MPEAKPLLSVEEALGRVTFGLKPLGREIVPLAQARGRVMAQDLEADRDSPPSDVSAMDGYAVRSADVGALPVSLKTIGAAPAGHPFGGTVGEGQAVRIFTGAAMPAGADAIVIQENTNSETDTVTIVDGTAETRYVRPQGLDFKKSQVLLAKGTKLAPRHVALAASMNHAEVTVWRKPRVGVLSTGDELVPPGTAGAGDVAASNSYGLLALVEAIGGVGINLGIAKDTKASLEAAFDAASGLDILVTIGGASVGEHDLVRDVLAHHGLDLDFWRIAMRPGKPLMHGTIRQDASGKTATSMRFLGLPGNPVSSMVCGQLYLKPMVTALTGADPAPSPYISARLGSDVATNDERQDYLRATLSDGPNGLVATPFSRQDSSMLSNLAHADCFIVRVPHAPAVKAGDLVNVLSIDI